MRWLAEASAIFAKEIRSEWRTKVALSSVALFTAGSLTLIALALVGISVRVEVAVALLWVTLFFTAATGLGRAFVQEEERGTALALQLTARASVVWAGKCAANFALLSVLTLLITPTLLAMLRVETQGANFVLLFVVLGLGSVGLAAVFTMTSALVAQASAKGGLLAALSFPILIPLLIAGVHGTRAALDERIPEMSRWTVGAGDVRVLASYAVIAVTASLMLFDFVWND